ncbi:hypothetical protein S40285_10623 [Stachybotrys chlorohalonatus IBT 40285]|uniref:Uncharacterized protein n=1 Tax=Stachybotrys chlorohalonatus (strain IBT 40285) TaxID=1283841 RepID=A0A084R0X8_STAC4|nr:hypothetical protein S40285_10623 [Stachybotrys chlorohalonata IBT 40285]
MGLATKIKDALHGDRDRNNLGSQRRRAPEGYPRTADTPRSNTNATWETAPTHADETLADDVTVKDEAYGEYTHSRPEDRQATTYGARPGQTENDVISEPDYDDGTPINTTSKQNELQPPYWGNVNRRNAPDYTAQDRNATRVPNATTGIQGEDQEYRNRAATSGSQTYAAGPDFGRTDASANAHQAVKQSLDLGGRGHGLNQGEVPINNVNRAQPVLVDDEATRAKSIAASQSWQPSQRADLDRHYNADTTGYGQDGNVSRTGYATTSDAYNTALPVRNRSMNNGQEASYGREGSAEPYYQGPTYVGQPNGQLAKQPGSDRDRVSPVFGSENGSTHRNKAENPDHFGPGHAGAKVLHRCEHCGNDNDITRYFSKDVVYRLS